MDSIFTLDEFPGILSNISRRLTHIHTAAPSFHNMNLSQQQAVEKDMSEVSKLICKMENSVNTLEGQPKHYQKWKAQVDQQSRRLLEVCSSLPRPECEETTENSHLLQQQTDSYGVELEYEAVSSNQERVSRVTQALHSIQSMMARFGEMVNEQASKIDSIEEYMENAAHRSTLALGQLERTNTSDKSSRTHKCILCLLVSLVLLSLTLVAVSVYS